MDKLYRQVCALATAALDLRALGATRDASALEGYANQVVSRLDRAKINKWMLGFLPSYDKDSRTLSVKWTKGPISGVGDVKVVPSRNNLDLLVVTLKTKQGEPSVLVYPHRLASERPEWLRLGGVTYRLTERT